VQGLQDSVCIADVRLDERKHLRGKVVDALFFDRPGIKGVKVVDRRDAVAVTQESTAEVAADETGSTSDANMHCINCFKLSFI
jgi:hypothetical protein